MSPRLRVTAGSSLEDLQDITDLVNTDKPARIESSRFEGDIVVNIKGFMNPKSEVTSSQYFEREDRRGTSWSFQVQGRFLKNYSADDILFGNTFDRPLQLPWGSGAALKFMSFIDPTLEHDLTSSSKPWALSPLITTMPHFAYKRVDDDDPSPTSFPPSHSITDDTSTLHLALASADSGSSSSASSSSTSLSSNSSKKSHLSLKKTSKRSKQRRDGQPFDFQNASQRRSYFSSADTRQSIHFGLQDEITTDFCYGFLEFSPTISLRIPGGLSFDLMKYWDGQPVRFVCCERKGLEENDGQPWGKILWCVVIELCED